MTTTRPDAEAGTVTRFRRCPECRANITTVERVVSWRPAAVGSLSSPVDTGNTLEEAAVSATFQAGGQTWPVRLTVGTIGRLRSEVGFEVTQRAIETTDFVQTLFFDPMKFAEVLWVAVCDEAKGRGITKDAFFDTLGGEELQEAGNVFASAVVDHLFGSRAAPVKKKLDEVIATLNERFGALVVASMDAALSVADGITPTPATAG